MTLFDSCTGNVTVKKQVELRPNLTVNFSTLSGLILNLFESCYSSGCPLYQDLGILLILRINFFKFIPKIFEI